ncbi:M16 family metallopeptidase [Campylobacter corcagiensis]|uniref:Insulinase family protein n=1 Tax=Campylobacter corcagiensis TaxID=1448857 RepID=A0A7M1LIU5_9BACT|nr:insulinase family protein [Campylobacter corcagiensis]QKF64389.1 zinc-dependent peptidase, M16 family [Campylobacter corcagiensis]QOQ87425.1 insulinase family protein [Campylobacter corcagiensis]
MKRILILLLLSLSPLFCLNLDENLSVKKLDNGLTYYLYENSALKDSVSLILHIKAGSSDEKDNERGIAHFVEHMAFNGTKDFSKNELIKALESLGVKFGPDLNAMTGFDKTIYKIDIKNEGDNLNTALKVLANLGFKVKFEPKDLEAEKGVIVAEDKNRQSGMQRVFEQSLPYYYKDSIYEKRLPIGDMDIVRSATSELMRGFYERYYQPDNASLIVVGDFNKTQISDFIKVNFGDINGTSVKKDDKPIGYFNEMVVFNAFDKDITNQSVNFMFEGNFIPENSYENIKEMTKVYYISTLISLISNKRQSNGDSLIKSAFYPMDLYNKKSLNTFSLSVVDGNFTASVAEFSTILKGLRENGFSQNLFENAKTDLKALNLTSFKTSSSRKNQSYINEILNYIDSNTTFLSPKDSYEINEKILNELTLDDINEKFLDITKSTGVIVSIISKDEQNITKDEILEIYKNVKPLNTSEKVLPKTLLDANLSKVDPIKTEFDDKNLIHTYEFENGAKVHFKEMDTDKETVYFNAFKKGGYTNIPNINEAIFAVNISNGSGIGEFNDYEVRTITAGEVFNFSKFINRVSRGYSGSFLAKDMESFFKAFFVDFHAPKIDDNYFKNYITLSLDTLKRNLLQPDYKFALEFNDFYYAGNEKMKFADEKFINSLDKNRLEILLNELFSNAGEYEFIFVGDIKADKFLDMASRYIGNLNGDKKPTSIKDDGIREIDGTHKFERNYLSENVSKNTIIVKSYDLNYTAKNDIALELTTAVLNTLMREKIREDDGKVYGISAYPSLSVLPYQRAITSVYFTSEVNQKDEIYSDVKAIMENLKAGYKDEKELNSAKTVKKVELEKNFQQPGFWLMKMVNSKLFGIEFLNFDESIKLVDSITLDDIKEISNKAFDFENVVISSNIYKDSNLTN